jgi:hypothetical protein
MNCKPPTIAHLDHSVVEYEHQYLRFFFMHPEESSKLDQYLVNLSKRSLKIK